MRKLTAGERGICKNISYPPHDAQYVMDKFHELWGDQWVIVDFRPPMEQEYAIGASDSLPPFYWDDRCTEEPRFIIRKRHPLGRWCPLRWKR